jgi:hypothetical protein
VWNWLIRPKSRSANGWSEIASGCLILAAGIVLVFIPYDGVPKFAAALVIVGGVRWIVVGTMQRRSLDGNATSRF